MVSGRMSIPPDPAPTMPEVGQYKDSTERSSLGGDPCSGMVGKDKAATPPVERVFDSTVNLESDQAPASSEGKILIGDNTDTMPSNGKGLLNVAAKHKFKATPHSKKARPTSPSRTSNAFSTLSKLEVDVESLILKAQQSRKTIHPKLLGTSGRDIEPGGRLEQNIPPDRP